MTSSPCHISFKRKPAFGNAVCRTSIALKCPGTGISLRQCAFQHGSNVFLSLTGIEVPGKGKKVTPVTILIEHLYYGIDFPTRECLPKPAEPLFQLGINHILCSHCHHFSSGSPAPSPVKKRYQTCRDKYRSF